MPRPTHEDRSAIQASLTDMRALGAARRVLISEIEKIIAPHLWVSGFVERDRKGQKCGNIRLWCDMKDGKVTDKTWKLGGYVANEVFGVTSDSLIVDSCYMIVTTPFEALPLEDLIRVRRWVEKLFVKTKEIA